MMKKSFMKNAVFFLLVMGWSVVATLTSCKKDEPKDPCSGITCLNGGTCANGACNCPPGYAGSDCSQLVTPKKVTITKIQITKFPATEVGGAGWDPTSGPELYPKISLGSTTIYSSTLRYTDANPNLVPYEFAPNPYVELNDPSSQYLIEAYDYDTVDPDDWMGGIYFYPYSSSTGFPSIVLVEAAGATVAFKLELVYTW
jgi:hypothetical protein